MMKTKLSLLSFLLLPTLGFSCPGAFYVYSTTAIYLDTPPTSPLQCLTGWDRQPEQFCKTVGGVPDQYGRVNVSCDRYYPAASCPDGTQLNDSINKICAPACASGTVYSSNTNLCEPTFFSSYDNNPTGCDAAGGYYFKDNKCRNGSEAIKKMLTDPNVVIGAGLVFNGLLWTTAGIAGYGVSGGMTQGAVTAGIYAMAAGIGSIFVGIDGQLSYSSTSDTAPSATPPPTPEGMKVKLIDDPLGGGSSIVKSDPTTGKVTEVTQISQATKDAFNAAVADLAASNRIDALKANTSEAPIPMTSSPSISLKDTAITKIDYSTNTATTETHTPVSTVASPSITTSTVPVTVTQNSDGTVSTSSPTNNGYSWTVTGSNGGYVTYTSQPETGTGGTGTGTTTGAGPDYSGVLNDIKTNTGESKTILQEIKDFFTGMFDNSDSVDTSTVTGLNADGHEGFDGFKGDVEGSLNGFVFTDPLGLNGITGSGIGSYGFSILGHHYIILDQAMIDKLPLSLLRNLFLFLAALAGLITVVSGV